MRKTLFTLIAAVMAVVGYAQKKELVTLPTGVEANQWYITGGAFNVWGGDSYGWIDYSSFLEGVNVAISGNDIYFQGLAYYMGEAWVKGTINGNVITIPTGQYLGTDSDGDEYLNGQPADAQTGDEPAVDIVFAYDAEAGTLTLDANVAILESGEQNSLKATYAYWEGLVLSNTKPQAVELPEGLEPVEYLFTGTDDYDNSEVQRAAFVAFDGTDAYIKGLTNWLPEGWVKGTFENGKITIPANQYMGDMEYGYSTYALYFNPNADVEFTVSEDKKTITATAYSITSGGESVEGYLNVSLKFTEEKAGTPANPAITTIEPYDGEDNLYIVEFNVPITDNAGNAMLTSKLSYKFYYEAGGNVSEYTFTSDKYQNVETSMKDVPYGFTDEYDFYPTYIYFAEDMSTWSRIGIQATYTGGGETHATEIQWVNVADVMGINSVQTDRNNGRNAIYNLNGQRVNNATKGLYIINGKKVVIK